MKTKDLINEQISKLHTSKNTKLTPRLNSDLGADIVDDIVKIRIREANEVKTRTEPALPIQNVSRWAYFFDNAKPLMIGFIAAILLNTTYKLIETIIIKIALIVNGG
ncbi:hypothetical protein [Sunxiuqinia elliptica]|uniref:Uncharacterized protein n=1 Tax=Sunxiuqinia elliptica TaxID=655355 RepID=A0A1I2L929_9BACT|nr:hypothetical protein [Sunxiuqinia elliptica]SFF73711.1 hypothetical protein SAMN05216283_11485 [Sunxiuqinia elliptica]